jgi:hypothetical protein
MGRQLRSKWMLTALLLLLAALPAAGQQARLVRVARKAKHQKKSAAPAVQRGQMELAQQMARNAYALGVGLEPRQRVALMTRLLYTMRPEVMAAEKKLWAEELFGLAQRLPVGDAEAPDDARNAAIATAAARVAVYDSDRALQLLDSLPGAGGSRADARTMAARLVFTSYLQHHGAAGAETLLEHGRRWGERGGFPYGASAAAAGKLLPNEAAADEYFRQVLGIFARGQEGVYGVNDFAGLLEQGAAMGAISAESAEAAGRAVVAQLRTMNDNATLSDEQKGEMAEALNHVRLSAPVAYGQARREAPELLEFRRVQAAPAVENAAVDAGLQSAFHELAEAVQGHGTPEEVRATIGNGLRLVNARYRAGRCAGCLVPDAQSWALVSLAAYAAPKTIASQLSGIEEPFWHAYFLAIAAQQVGQPTRVADPTARRVAGKEEAEPE